MIISQVTFDLLVQLKSYIILFLLQVKIAAMTVNGSGPATPWMEAVTYAADLDESAVPDTPSSLRAKVGRGRAIVYTSLHLNT